MMSAAERAARRGGNPDFFRTRGRIYEDREMRATPKDTTKQKPPVTTTKQAEPEKGKTS